MPVVDAPNCAAAGNMIQGGLGMIAYYAQPRHPSACGAAEIMEMPILDARL